MSSLDQEVLLLRQKVGKLERQVAFLLDHLKLEYVEEANLDVSPEVLELVKKGKMTQAVVQFRKETGFGLKEAKDFVESIEA